MKLSMGLAACALAGIVTSPLLAHVDEVSPERLEADVRFLADDRLEGREAGEPGYNLAAGYVAGQFAAIGLETSEGDSFLQSVPLGYSQLVEGSAIMSIDGKALSGDDFIAFPANDFAGGVIEAPLVFVGYAFGDADAAWDDFAGIDLAGKIAVVVRNTPKMLGAEERAFYRAGQWERLAEKGAVGAIFLPTPSYFERVTWEALQRYSLSSGVNWVGPDGRVHNTAKGLDATIMISEKVARELLHGQKRDFDRIVALEERGDVQLGSFDLGRTARIEMQTKSWQDPSYNVIGILPGSDPVLADEVVVVTAHLDAIGVRPTDEEGDDEIVNGAMDNAVGVAAITELARQMVKAKPRRTIAFVALTAEEKGLIGADYLARHPQVGEGRRIVANINLDMPSVDYEFTDIVAFGAERWNGFDIVRGAVESEGLKLSPDEQPELGLFTRSDHYRFVQQGIPAIYLDTGIDGEGKQAIETFLAEHYHRPSDEVANIRFDQLARFTRLNLAVLRGIADMEETPVWNAGDFFATRFGGEMAD
ncbi:M28 family peptidase [Qipengyuania sphaerica]|uniref:M28 family peptidase n=1 Tax=Qipengyuania sphaerica TaxID=2867243 RepID=UPI001C888E83|nr:M28 family peptidase [Qipengyuania sphaerica]MBX7541124.1 M20/M25/M40 family metallo-hydrolase [Qipengyuania sphaerica]